MTAFKTICIVADMNLQETLLSIEKLYHNRNISTRHLKLIQKEKRKNIESHKKEPAIIKQSEISI